MAARIAWPARWREGRARRVVDSGPPAELEVRCALYRDLWSAYHDTERWRLSDTTPAAVSRAAGHEIVSGRL